MKRYQVKAPCGAVFVKIISDDAEVAFQAYLAQLTRDHEDNGPGCPACKPQNWLAPKPSAEPPVESSSLLDKPRR